MIEYDMIVSLGGSCAEANQLKVRGLRLVSSPFDWIFTKEPISLEHLAECFRDGFANWLKTENLVEIDPTEYNPKAAQYQYRDAYTGYRFIHDYLQPKEKCAEEVRERYMRRINRMCERFRVARNIALCFDADFPGSTEPMKAIREILLERYGRSKKIDLFLVEFSADRYECVKDGPLSVFRFTHPKPLNIFGSHPTFEFNYMDDFTLSGLFKSEERGKGNRLYLAHTAHGVKCVLFKNQPRRFGLTLTLGQRKYEFAWGGGVS